MTLLDTPLRINIIIFYENHSFFYTYLFKVFLFRN